MARLSRFQKRFENKYGVELNKPGKGRQSFFNEPVTVAGKTLGRKGSRRYNMMSQMTEEQKTKFMSDFEKKKKLGRFGPAARRAIKAYTQTGKYAPPPAEAVRHRPGRRARGKHGRA